MSALIDQNGNAVAVREEASPAVMTPMAMLTAAVERGASVEVMEKLLSLHERWEANQARKAFDEAVALAKARIKPVARNKSGHNDKRYADFAAIAREVDPVLGELGLSYRFRTSQTDRINVTCILSHKLGHHEEHTLSGPPDASGSKNAIQAIGSTLTYLQRYSLVQALGIAAGDDDDGSAVGKGETITDEQREALSDLIEQAGADIRRLCEHFRIEGLAQLPAKRYGEADKLLRQKIKAKEQRQ